MSRLLRMTLAALGLSACEHRGEAESPRPSPSAPPFYDDRAFGPTEQALPQSSPTSPPAASMPPGGRPPTEPGLADSVQSSAAHERFGGEFGARDSIAGAASRSSASGAGGGDTAPRASDNAAPSQ